MLLRLPRSDDARVVDIVERGEEGDVVVGKAQLLRVLRGEAHRAAEDRVVRPDAVLQEQREETDGEGQVETGFLTGETGIDGADVTLEEQRLRVEVELIDELPIAAAAAELVAGEFCIVLKRREEGVYSFGAGDLEVDVDVQPGRDLGNIIAVVLVVGDRRPPVAVDGEARDQRILFTQEGAALVVCRRRCIAGDPAQAAGAAARPRSSRRRCRRSLGIVVLVVLRTGSEKVFLAVHVAARACRPRCRLVLSAGLLLGVAPSVLRVRLGFGGIDPSRRSGHQLGQLASLAGLAAALPAAGSAVVPDITR